MQLQGQAVAVEEGGQERQDQGQGGAGRGEEGGDLRCGEQAPAEVGGPGGEDEEGQHLWAVPQPPKELWRGVSIRGLNWFLSFIRPVFLQATVALLMTARGRLHAWQ